MSTFSDLLAAVGLAPKTLPQAKETLDTAKATLDSVAALFTSAGLNLEQMLAAGPDALKAHLESIDNTEELAEALQENESISAKLETETGLLNGAIDKIAAHEDVFAAVGFKPGAGTAEDFKKAHEGFVAKQTTLALAKTGHPPAHVPAADVAPSAAKPTGAELHATWKAMKAGPERLAFFTQHEAAITSFERNNSPT